MGFMGGVFLIFIVIYGMIMLVSLAVLVLSFIAHWKLFEKAGEPGWSAIIPVYNYFKVVKIATGRFLLAWVYFAVAAFYTVFYFAIAIITTVGEIDESSPIFLIIMAIPYLISIPMCVLSGYVNYMFAKSYGQTTLVCVLSIFFGGIVFIVLGFDRKTVYIGPKGIPTGYNQLDHRNTYGC